MTVGLLLTVNQVWEEETALGSQHALLQSGNEEVGQRNLALLVILRGPVLLRLHGEQAIHKVYVGPLCILDLLLTRSGAQEKLEQNPFLRVRHRKESLQFIRPVRPNLLLHELHAVGHILDAEVPQESDNLTYAVVDCAISKTLAA